MKSLIIAVSCSLIIALSTVMVEAATLHDQRHVEELGTENDWFSSLYRQQEAENIFFFASEKFRSIPKTKTIPLSLDGGGGDPLRLFSIMPKTTDPEQLHKNWIELLFGVRSWNVEDENGLRSISVHSTSTIPLPAALPLFLGGIGFLLLMRLRRRANT